MSIDTCVKCSRMVDTDYDCGAYYLLYDEDSNKESGEVLANNCHCYDCRYFNTKQEALLYNESISR